MRLSEPRRFPVTWEGVKGKWQQLSKAKKAASIVLGAAILTTVFFVARVLLRPPMSPLFTGLEAADAGRIAAKLQELGVDYELDQEGQTILVKDDEVYDLRIQLASDGALMGGSAGFELFDKTKLGTTEFERRLDYQRALQEELRRTIVQLEEVEQARVHLTLPEPSVFVTETAAPSASIVLKLNPFSQLEQAQVRGIMHLVAASVENLTPEQITVVDTQGNLLSDLYTAEQPALPADAAFRQFKVRRAFEQELEQRVQRLLDRVLGPGQAIAMMTAELDFNSQETTVITYADDGVPRSRTVKRETWVGSEGSIVGEAGTDSNIPGYVLPEDSEGGAYEKIEETVNYEVSETTNKQIFAPGRLLKLHTAVVVNNKNGEVTPQQVAQIRSTVAAAVGYQQDRGDTIDVQGMNFSGAAGEEILPEPEDAWRSWQRYAVYGTVVLGGLLLLLLVLRLWSRRRAGAAETEVPSLPTLPEQRAAALISAEQSKAGEDDSRNQQVRKLAEKEPEMAAFLIRAWLAEE